MPHMPEYTTVFQVANLPLNQDCFAAVSLDGDIVTEVALVAQAEDRRVQNVSVQLRGLDAGQHTLQVRPATGLGA